MKSIFSTLTVLGLFVALAGCSDSDNSSASTTEFFPCDNPVLVSADDNQPVPGFIVYIDETVKTGDIEIEFVEKYEDITIFSSFPRNNSFYANISDETLMRIQCEPDVIAIAEM